MSTATDPHDAVPVDGAAPAAAGGTEPVPVHVPADATSIEVGPDRLVLYRGEDIIEELGASPADPLRHLVLPSSGATVDAALRRQVDTMTRDILEIVGKTARTTFDRIGSAHAWHLRMNVAVFVVGLASFVAAVVSAVLGDGGTTEVTTTAVFGGLSAVSFVTYFVARPVEAMRVAGPQSTWLLAIATTYWTKMVYLDDPATIVRDVEKAQRDMSRALAEMYATTATGRPAGATETEEDDDGR